jgi:hypothetical protein
MICVECGADCPDGGFKEFSKGSVRLTRCECCHRLADKYVEFEMMLIILDLILHKPQVYRHLLYNRPQQRSFGVDVRIYIFFNFFYSFEVFDFSIS